MSPLPSFFERAQKQEAIFDFPDFLDFLFTHPDTEEKIIYIQETAKLKESRKERKTNIPIFSPKKNGKC